MSEKKPTDTVDREENKKTKRSRRRARIFHLGSEENEEGQDERFTVELEHLRKINASLKKPVEVDLKFEVEELDSLNDVEPPSGVLEKAREDFIREREARIAELQKENQSHAVRAKHFSKLHKSDFQKKITIPLNEMLDAIAEAIKSGNPLPENFHEEVYLVLNLRINEEVTDHKEKKEVAEQKSKTKKQDIEYHTSKMEHAIATGKVLKAAYNLWRRSAEELDKRKHTEAMSALQKSGQMDYLKDLIDDEERLGTESEDVKTYLGQLDPVFLDCVADEIVKAKGISGATLKEFFDLLPSKVAKRFAERLYASLEDNPKLLTEALAVAVNSEITKQSKDAKTGTPFRGNDIGSLISGIVLDEEGEACVRASVGPLLEKWEKGSGPLEKFSVIAREGAEDCEEKLAELAKEYIIRLRELVHAVASPRFVLSLPAVTKIFCSQIKREAEGHYDPTEVGATITRTLVASPFFRKISTPVTIGAGGIILGDCLKHCFQGTDLTLVSKGADAKIAKKLGLQKEIDSLHAKYVAPLIEQICGQGAMFEDAHLKPLAENEFIADLARNKAKPLVMFKSLCVKLGGEDSEAELELTSGLGAELLKSLPSLDGEEVLKALPGLFKLVRQIPRRDLRMLCYDGLRRIEVSERVKLFGHEMPESVILAGLLGEEVLIELQKAYERSNLTDQQEEYATDKGSWTEVPRDGNCLFHCLVHAEVGDDHTQLREGLANDIQTNGNLAPFITDMEAAVREVGRNKAYLGEAAFMTDYIAETQNLRITVVEEDGREIHIGHGLKHVVLARKSNHYWVLKRPNNKHYE